jgi:hypothetical protein
MSDPMDGRWSLWRERWAMIRREGYGPFTAAFLASMWPLAQKVRRH